MLLKSLSVLGRVDVMHTGGWMRYYMYRDERDGLWKWCLLTDSGQTVARSMQAYFSAAQCREAIAAVMQAGPQTPIDANEDRVAPMATVAARARAANPSAAATSNAQFEDVGLKKSEKTDAVPAHAPNEIPQMGN